MEGALSQDAKPKLKARIAWAAAASLLFVGVYNACNWITTQRADVGTWFFPWELHIPFVPWMILPYWSLDLFFLASFFICRSDRELKVLSTRLMLAILVAGAFFLAMPLTTVFPRHEVPGFFGFLFEALRSFDQPHNLFPSLHIAFRTLLAAHFVRHSRGLLRLSVHLWFSLIGVSTLLTYQHHVVDVLGGFALALLCFYAIPAEKGSFVNARNPKVAIRYGLGSLICGIAAIALAMDFNLPWPLRWAGAGLGWPAFALFMTALAYGGRGGRIYRKASGTLPWSARLLLAPVLWGHWISFLHYKRQCQAWNEVAPGLLVGRRLSEKEAQDAVLEGVVAVLDLTAESSENKTFLKLPYLNLPVLDLTAPSPEQIQLGLAFIKTHLPKGKIYIHCKIGYSRSAAMAAAFLMDQGMKAEEALLQLKAKRPRIVIRPEIRKCLMGQSLAE